MLHKRWIIGWHPLQILLFGDHCVVKYGSSCLNTNCPAVLLWSISALLKIIPCLKWGLVSSLHFSEQRFCDIDYTDGYRNLKSEKKGLEDLSAKRKKNVLKSFFFFPIWWLWEGQEWNIKFTNSIPFTQKTNSCFNYCYTQLDSTMYCWLVCYYL